MFKKVILNITFPSKTKDTYYLRTFKVSLQKVSFLLGIKLDFDSSVVQQESAVSNPNQYMGYYLVHMTTLQKSVAEKK
jgi:hypothetical protein